MAGRGYEPINIGSIDTIGHFDAGDLTYSIGFPDLSNRGKKQTRDSFEYFQSNDVTVPVVSVGKFLGLKVGTPYLISDVFVYHGHSGGPLIWNNKLIGIVHGANLETREVYGTRLKSYYFLNGNEFIKSKYIMPLLRELTRQIKINESALNK